MSDIKFLVPEKIYLPQAKENECYRRASLVSVMKCTLDNDDPFETQSNKASRHCTLFTNTLKSEFRPKGIEPTRFICFELLEVSQL